MSKWRKFFPALALLLTLAFSGGIASAEVKSFTAEGRYLMSVDETIGKAKEGAVKEALRAISEKAAVFVKSYSEMKFNVLVTDEIEAAAASLMKVKKKTFKNPGPAGNVGDGLQLIIVEVTADIDTDDVDTILRKFIEARKAGGSQNAGK